jgi:hypothetical protein
MKLSEQGWGVAMKMGKNKISWEENLSPDQQGRG